MKHYKFPIALGVFLLILDRMLKILALRLPAEGFFCCQKTFGIKLFLNEGIAFGLPLPQIVSIIVSSLIAIILIHLFIKKQYNSLGLILIIVGAINNLFDKVRHQAIIDLFTIKHLTVFNLSDVYIVMGLVVVILSYKRAKKSSF